MTIKVSLIKGYCLELLILVKGMNTVKVSLVKWYRLIFCCMCIMMRGEVSVVKGLTTSIVFFLYYRVVLFTIGFDMR